MPLSAEYAATSALACPSLLPAVPVPGYSRAWPANTQTQSWTCR